MPAVHWRLAAVAAVLILGAAPPAGAAPRDTTARLSTMPDTSKPMDAPPIIELRQYTLRPGRRDDLLNMFDAAFVEPQEAVGITVIGQFRDLDDPDRFVWLRGFPTMEARATALGAFYGGDAWLSRRSAANETIIDNDNVLLLRPVHPGAGWTLDRATRAPAGARGAGRGVVIATVYHIDPTDEKERDFVRFFEHDVTPLLTAAGAGEVMTFVPERAPNTFPRLPVREGERVFAWFTRFPDTAAYQRFQATLATTPAWRDSVAVQLKSRIREPNVLRLAPSARSLLHY